MDCSRDTDGRGLSRVMGRRTLLRAGLSAPLLALPGLALGREDGPRPFSARVIQSGHSLTDPIIPALSAIVAAVGGREAQQGVIDGSTVPGSPMQIRWKDRPQSGPDAREDIAKYDVLVMTERAPVLSAIEWHDSQGMALRWFKHARAKGNGGRGADMILYASWVHVDSGPGFKDPSDDPEGQLPFRERMGLEMPRWQGIADYVNANRPPNAPEMPVIPGPLIMAAVYDAIKAGTAPGLTDIRQLFRDSIHINDDGAYLIAAAHFAVIYRRDPREVPSRMGLQPVPAPETAEFMKEIVAQVLRDYPGSGLQGII